MISAEMLDMLFECLKDDKMHWVAAQVIEELKEIVPVEFVQRLFAASYDEKSQMRHNFYLCPMEVRRLSPDTLDKRGIESRVLAMA